MAKGCQAIFSLFVASPARAVAGSKQTKAIKLCQILLFVFNSLLFIDIINTVNTWYENITRCMDMASIIIFSWTLPQTLHAGVPLFVNKNSKDEENSRGNKKRVCSRQYELSKTKGAEESRRYELSKAGEKKTKYIMVRVPQNKHIVPLT